MTSKWLQYTLLCVFISPGVDHSSWFSVVSSKGTLPCWCPVSIEPSYRKPWPCLSPYLVSWHLGKPLALCFSSSSSTLSSRENPAEVQKTLSRPRLPLSYPFPSCLCSWNSSLTSKDAKSISIRKAADLASFARSHPKTKGIEELRQE